MESRARAVEAERYESDNDGSALSFSLPLSLCLCLSLSLYLSLSLSRPLLLAFELLPIEDDEEKNRTAHSYAEAWQFECGALRFCDYASVNGTADQASMKLSEKTLVNVKQIQSHSLALCLSLSLSVP